MQKVTFRFLKICSKVSLPEAVQYICKPLLCFMIFQFCNMSNSYWSMQPRERPIHCFGAGPEAGWAGPTNLVSLSITLCSPVSDAGRDLAGLACALGAPLRFYFIIYPDGERRCLRNMMCPINLSVYEDITLTLQATACWLIMAMGHLQCG